MPQRNVMPTLPNQVPPRQQKPGNPKRNDNGLNVKALIILAAVVIGIIILIIVKGNSPSKYEQSDSSLVAATSSEVPEATTSDPIESEPVVVEADPADNAGTELTDLLAEGSVFNDANKYVLATDINYPGAVSCADSTVVSLDKNMTLSPSASCAYAYGFNSVNITHTSGSVLYLARDAAADYRNMPTAEDYLASLEVIAKKNGVVKPLAGKVYVGSSCCGSYVKGTLKVNKEETDKTLLLMHISGNPEIYSVAVIYTSQDELDILLNSLKLYGSSLKLN